VIAKKNETGEVQWLNESALETGERAKRASLEEDSSDGFPRNSCRRPHPLLNQPTHFVVAPSFARRSSMFNPEELAKVAKGGRRQQGTIQRAMRLGPATDEYSEARHKSVLFTFNPNSKKTSGSPTNSPHSSPAPQKVSLRGRFKKANKVNLAFGQHKNQKVSGE